MGNYLFNGVECPVPREFDKSAFRYMVITQAVSNCSLFCWASKPDTTVRANGYDYHEYNNAPYIQSHFWKSEGATEWDEFKEYNSGYYPLSTIVWANFDVYSSDGTLFMKASYPIDKETGEEVTDYGLYPIPVLNPTAILMGYSMGAKL